MVTSSTQHTKHLCKYNDAPPFKDINNIFNAPPNVAPRGHPLSPHSHWSPSLTLPRPVPHHHGAVCGCPSFPHSHRSPSLTLFILLSGRGIAQPHLQHHMFTAQKSMVIPLIALLQQVLPRNYSNVSGTKVKHILEGQGLETMSSKSLV